MADTRTKNVTRNIIFGTLYRIVTLLLPFFSRTIMLYLLGTTSVGINTLFTSLLSFLSLAELGFGAAVVYSMYKPIADGDSATICALLNYYKRLYRIIGFVILCLGIAMTPFLGVLIKGETPAGVSVTALYYLYLINTIISYFAFGYKQSLLIAFQRTDIRDKIALIVTVCVRALEIISLLVTKNLYVFVCASIIGTLATNIVTAIVTRKMYPNLKCKGEIDLDTKKEISKKLGGLFGTKLNSIVVNQADTIVISAFLGLTLLAQYGNYYYVLNAISGFVMILFSSMTASIGNKIASDSRAAVYELFTKINFANNWIVGWCTICMLCLYRPFMILWVKEDLTLPITMSVLMALYFYIYQIQRTILTFKDAGGLWYEDRFRPYVSMIFNVVSNIILVQIVGIYGVVISTIIAFLISVPWCNYVVFKYMFRMSAKINILKMIKNFAVTAAIGIATYTLCTLCGNGVLGLCERMLICAILPNIAYLLVFYKNREFKELINTVKSLRKSRL